MGLFKWIWEHSTLYSCINTIKYKHKLNKDHKNIDHLVYGMAFSSIIKKYLHIDLSRDWIGRLYGVINPNLDIDGKFDPSTMIIEIDGDNTNNNEYVHSWIYKQLTLVSNLFNFKDIDDAISIEIKHVGPINQDNYLVIFDFTNRLELSKWRKNFLLHLGGLSIIAGILLIILL